MTSAAESITESLRRTRQLMVQVINLTFIFCITYDNDYLQTNCLKNIKMIFTGG